MKIFYSFRLCSKIFYYLWNMKVVVAADSFKGSLGSAEVARAIGAGIRSVYPDAEVVELAVADGGEGTAKTLVDALGGEVCECEVSDPMGRAIIARYGVAEVGNERTALIDVASASGLTLLSPDERDVMRASTRGTGEMIRDAMARGCKRFLIGLGGSATCDGGTGMLRALGVRFLDAAERDLAEGGGSLAGLHRIDDSGLLKEIRECRVEVMCDVGNVMCGTEGAARIFGPQKGATAEEVEILEAGMRRYASAIEACHGRNVSVVPGSGAAGGLGGAFLAFFNSELKRGVDAVLDLVDFDAALAGADLVITGEGKIDRQTLYGKLPLGVCRRASAAGVPTIAFAGIVEDTEELLRGGFSGVFPIQSRPTDLTEAMRPPVAAANLRGAAASLARREF